MWVRIWHPLTALYPEPAVSPGAPASSFLLPPSAQCSETKKSRGQGSRSCIDAQHKMMFWLQKSFILLSGNTLNIIILVLSHFHLNISKEENVLEPKQKSRKSSHSGCVRPSSGLGSYTVSPHFPLFALISWSLPGKRWPVGVEYQPCSIWPSCHGCYI